jgi:hypothetical protein
MASVALTAFQRLQEKSAIVGVRNTVTALAMFLLHLELNPAAFETAKWN